jgi:hypothetical protein
MRANVNFKINGLVKNNSVSGAAMAERTISGSVLLLAVKNEDSEMVSFLLSDLGADPNATIFIDGKVSTILLFVISSISM